MEEGTVQLNKIFQWNPEKDTIENVGVALDKVSKIKDIQDNINEKYEKDVQRSAELNEEDSDAKTDEVSEDEGGE